MSSTEEIDIVIPWVDGSDPEWQAERDLYATESDKRDAGKASDQRYRSWDNLQYVFRGIEEFAPWVRTVHFITWGHLPEWLDTSNSKLHIVKHKDYIPSSYLPTFSSHTIELNMHRIEGLAQHFIYFNDDMFLLKPTVPEDFFMDGLPCDSAAMNAVSIPPYSTMCPPLYNAQVINRHFAKKQILKGNGTKWYSLKYPSFSVRTLLLRPWPRVTGFGEPHVPIGYDKRTLETLWEVEYDVLDKTCSHKFREATDVNQWLFRDWQLASGQFHPRKASFGKRFNEPVTQAIVDHIVSQKSTLLCVNDDATPETFEKEKALLIAAFDKILPNKSSFEL